MMLQEFTWQQFLIAMAVLSLIWFVVFWLLYHGGAARQSAGRKSGIDGEEDFGPLRHGWEEEVDALEDDPMGKPKLEHGVSVLEADDFSFVPASAEPGKTDLLGDVADFQQELKEICQVIEKEDGTKEDFFSLFAMLKDKYPQLASSDLKEELNGFIRELMPF